jgi:hypothetical protein
MDQSATTRIALVVPVFNDWESVAELLLSLDRLPQLGAISFHVILVDDGSNRPRELGLDPRRCVRTTHLEVLNLVCNLGHQRAIAVGLAAAADLPNISGVLVMDSDGEDRPEDISALLDAAARFDTILYLDVIERIADDAAEFQGAANHLAPQGRLVVLAPAHQFLFSPFDAAIGHHRRYTAGSLRAIGPRGGRVEVCRMLDSVGFFASLANRLLLRTAQPTPGQIKVWDTMMVPASGVVDRLSGFVFGRSVAAVWSFP